VNYERNKKGARFFETQCSGLSTTIMLAATSLLPLATNYYYY